MTEIERQAKQMANNHWLNGFATGVLLMSVFALFVSIVVRL